MSANLKRHMGNKSNRAAERMAGPGISRRGFFGIAALLGLTAMARPTEQAYAWSSWTNVTSSVLKGIGMGDCVHEDLVQISYARVLRNHTNDAGDSGSLLNPWAGAIQADARYATIAGDTVDIGEGKTFADDADLAARLFRENLAYLRIGSFWNDAAANMLADFTLSCYYADSVPTFSGNDHYAGAWDVGQHLCETSEDNKSSWFKSSRDSLVQFTMNDRAGFIHGMLTSTASHSGFLSHSEVKQLVLQWLGVAYEYARTGQVTATSDVAQAQAEQIFKGFIDTYGQLDENEHGMCVSLKVSSSEASIKLPHRRLRLRALGMMCHTMEDLWCPAHTCRTYHAGGAVPQNSILAFCNYKRQNGSKTPMFGYHIPFDRYAVSDSKNSTNWREALTRGDGNHVGTETLANVLDAGMNCLDGADTYFNTLGMNETISTITELLEYLYQGTAWDNGVREWVDTQIMPTFIDDGGQPYVCDAGRRGLHTPTFVIAPLQAVKRAFQKVGLSANYDEILGTVKSYDAWQRGSHLFYSGEYNTDQSKYITSGHEGDSIWDDSVGESRLVALVDKLHGAYSSMDADGRAKFISAAGCNGCHDMVAALGMVEGMLQEFCIDLRGNVRANGDETMAKLSETLSFFRTGLKEEGSKLAQSASSFALFAPQVAFADEVDEGFVTANMAIDDIVGFEDGSYFIAVRDMDSLGTSIMSVPTHTPGKDKLEEGLANLKISYMLNTEFDDDLDYCYIVTDIDYADMEEDVHFVTGTVRSVSEDKKSLDLDLNGMGEVELKIRDGLADVPQAEDYICARLSSGGSDLELVGYDLLEAPDELMKATYPVAKVAGTSVWLLTNGDDSDAEDGYRNYLQVYYGLADVYSMPVVGEYATVYYHDEAYGDVTDFDEEGFAAADSTMLDTQSADDDADDGLNDSADTPGYIGFSDEYDDLVYGNEVFHVANAISNANSDADLPTPQTEDEPSASGSDQGQQTSQPTGSPSVPATDQPNNSNAGDASTKWTNTSRTGGAELPKTGDPLGALGGLMTGLSVAGTALTAYSARRLANERKNSEEDSVV